MTEANAKKTVQIDPVDRYAPADEYVAISELVPYAHNARTHSPEQVEHIAASMKRYGVTYGALRDAETLVAGHGRIMAAELLYSRGEELFHAPGEALGGRPIPKWTYPAKNCDGWTPEMKREYVLADNTLALEAGWNVDILRLEVDAIAGTGFDLDSIGLGEDVLGSIFADASASEDDGLSENYSRKIQAPIYEIKGEKPDPRELVDTSKADELRREIDDADVPQDVRDFLELAADRHAVFNFAKIAEFYAHADAPTQRLMEKSALVIIDFDQAIENGFVKLAEGMMEQADASKARNAE